MFVPRGPVKADEVPNAQRAVATTVPLFIMLVQVDVVVDHKTFADSDGISGCIYYFVLCLWAVTTN